jgi:hypothetical protein
VYIKCVNNDNDNNAGSKNIGVYKNQINNLKYTSKYNKSNPLSLSYMFKSLSLSLSLSLYFLQNKRLCTLHSNSLWNFNFFCFTWITHPVSFPILFFNIYTFQLSLSLSHPNPFLQYIHLSAKDAQICSHQWSSRSLTLSLSLSLSFHLSASIHTPLVILFT